MTINNTPFPMPSKLGVELKEANLREQRTLSGKLFSKSGGTYRVLTCRWNYMTENDLKALFAIFADNASAAVSYPDPVTGAERQMTALASDKSVGLFSAAGSTRAWNNITLTLTEVK